MGTAKPTTAASCAATRSSRWSVWRTTSTCTSSARWSGPCRRPPPPLLPTRPRSPNRRGVPATEAPRQTGAITMTSSELRRNRRGSNWRDQALVPSRMTRTTRTRALTVRSKARDERRLAVRRHHRVLRWPWGRIWAPNCRTSTCGATRATSASRTSPTWPLTRSSTAEAWSQPGLSTWRPTTRAPKSLVHLYLRQCKLTV